MAQTNFTPISLYYSATAAAVPTAGNLVAGELAINTADGKLFYKDSAGVVQTIATKDASAGTFTSITDSGNLTFTGTGNRIRGDFSNATQTNRVAFQTSTTNGSTIINAIPNGTATQSQWEVFNASDPTNAARGQFLLNASELSVRSQIAGTGSYVPLTMYTGGSERLRIDTSGNLSIGTTAAGQKLSIDGGIQLYGGANLRGLYWSMYGSTNSGYIDINGSSDGNVMRFGTANTERMRIDGSGNVGIGTSSPSFKLDVSGANGNGIRYLAAGGTSVIFGDAGGNSAYVGTLNNYPVRFTVNDTERMRIDSSGNVLVGTTTAPSTQAKLNVVGVAGAAYSSGLIQSSSSASGDLAYPILYLGKFDNNSTTSQVLVRFAINNFGAGQGQINGNGAGAAAFGSFSDSRLKENIIDLPSQLNNITALRPVEFNYIESEGGGHQVGFIAQEMQEVYPDAVGKREDGMLTITGWSKTEARLVKAIQEQQTLIENLTTRLNALEGN